MKKSRIFSALLVLALLSTCVIGGTFAKYTSTATGTATGTVAKWSFKVDTTEIATSTPTTFTFDLFGTINEEDTTTAEADVATGKIAPGTGGGFQLDVTNSSEVTAKYTVEYSITNTSNIPLKFSDDGGSTWSTTLSSLTYTSGNIDAGDTDTADKILWKWAFYESAAQDTADTALGIAAQTSAPTVTVTATIVATQVD